MLSIIIPTYNEEEYLPKLLKSIKNQDFKENYEIIVADAESTDSTKDIAKKFGCKIIKGGKHSVGVNRGANTAKGDILLIMDADTIMPPDFLNKNFKFFITNKLDVASCYIKTIDGKIIDKLIHAIANGYYYSFKRIKPYIPSYCLFIRKGFFFEVGCFDENVPWLVDLAFSNALPKKTRYDIPPIHIKLSIRMAERLGRFNQMRIMLLAAFLCTIGKNYHKEYKWKNKPIERTI